MTSGVERLRVRGWEVVRATNGPLQIDVLPGKGGDILAVRWLPDDLNLLWTSPWGLRAMDDPISTKDTAERFIHSYPGGWQTIFPNGGDATTVNGVEWPFHGEACALPWHLEIHHDAGAIVLRLTTNLTTVPFRLERTVTVLSQGLNIVETARNTGSDRVETMWSHHPAFGAPFLSGSARIECAATTFVADAARDVPASDLEPGASSPWPHAIARDGTTIDLRILPGPDELTDRFGYVTGFREGFAAITNTELRLRVEMRWDASIFPHAWYWLEAHATKGAPWHGDAYVFAIEPASSFPGHGVESVRSAGGTLVSFVPGEEKAVTISLDVRKT